MTPYVHNTDYNAGKVLASINFRERGKRDDLASAWISLWGLTPPLQQDSKPGSVENHTTWQVPGFHYEGQLHHYNKKASQGAW
jgi:hypothetical protein